MPCPISTGSSPCRNPMQREAWCPQAARIACTRTRNGPRELPASPPKGGSEDRAMGAIEARSPPWSGRSGPGADAVGQIRRTGARGRRPARADRRTRAAIVRITLRSSVRQRLPDEDVPARQPPRSWCMCLSAPTTIRQSTGHSKGTIPFASRNATISRIAGHAS